MRLTPLSITPGNEPLPPRVGALLAGARCHIDRWLARPGYRVGIGFVPSDYEQVWHALVAIEREHADTRRLLEWGSGFGVVAGLGALLGFEAYGIELDGELVASGRELLHEHGIDATLASGSFVPEDFADELLDDGEARTVLGRASAYDDLEHDLDDFDLVFAYPWPTEEELYCEIFRRHADYGAILLTWSRLEGARAYRKVAGAAP